jgi:hypothetical protein
VQVRATDKMYKKESGLKNPGSFWLIDKKIIRWYLWCCYSFTLSCHHSIGRKNRSVCLGMMCGKRGDGY